MSGMRERVSSLVPIYVEKEDLMHTQRERAASSLAIFNDSEENLFSANKDRFIQRPRINKRIHQGDSFKGSKFNRISNIALINPGEQFNPTSPNQAATKR